MKLTIETIRQLIKEELQHMSEAAPAAVKHKYREKFTNVKGWDKDSPQFYQVYNKGTQPQNPIIVEVYAKVLSYLYAKEEIHFMEHSGKNHKVFKTADCANKAIFDPEDSMNFNQVFEAYSTILGADAMPSSYRFDTSGGFKVIFDGEDAQKMAVDLGIPVDQAPNIPELSNFYMVGGEQWSYDGSYKSGKQLVRTAMIPLVHEDVQIKSCAVKKFFVQSKPLGIRLNEIRIVMQKEPELVEGESENKVLMRATDKVESLELEFHILSV